MADVDGFHHAAEARSWALHVEVARRLALDPRILQRARERVDGWLKQPARHPYAAAWRSVIQGSQDEVQRALGSRDEPMRTLRQASPFAGALDNKTRWRILAQYR